MVYGEMGKLPLQISVDKQLISYRSVFYIRITHISLHRVHVHDCINLFMCNEYNTHLIRVNHVPTKQLWFIIHVDKSTSSPHQTVLAHNT